MAVFKATNNRKDTNSNKFKATENRSYDSSIVGGWESTNNESLATINRYYEKISNGDYLSADDLKTYRSAIDSYVDSSTNLRGLNKSLGSNYTEEDEKKWTDSITSLNTNFDQASNYYSNWKTKKDYNDTLKAWERQEGLKGYDLVAGQTEIDELTSKKERKSWLADEIARIERDINNGGTRGNAIKRKLAEYKEE